MHSWSAPPAASMFSNLPMLLRAAALFSFLAVLPGAALAQRGRATVDTVRYVLAPEGTEARYRVREQLLGVDFPSDAVGKTSKVEGQLVVNSRGAIVSEQSKFVVDLASLVTDSERRDNYVRRNTLQTAQYATAQFVPRELRGLTFPLASTGAVTFQLIGDLTIRDQTRPVTWQVTGNLAQGAITGQASTKFTFADFAMTKPRVRSVLSVEDDIRLELDFRLVRGVTGNE